MPRYVSSAPPAPPAPPPKKPSHNTRRKKIFSVAAATMIIVAYGARFGLWGAKSKPVARTTTTTESTLEAPVTVAPAPATTLPARPLGGTPRTTR